MTERLTWAKWLDLCVCPLYWPYELTKAKNCVFRASLEAQMVKNLPVMQEAWV